MIILTDHEIVEGILGGIGWLLLMYQVKQILFKGPETTIFVTSIFSWTFFWYVRKIGMNLYKNYKERHQIRNDYLTINCNSDLPIVLFLIFLLGSSYYFAREYQFNRSDFYLAILTMLFALLLFLT